MAFPSQEFLNPTLRLDTTINHNRGYESIIKVDGWLKSEDGLNISYISEYLTVDERKVKMSARGTYQDKNRQEDTYHAILSTQLNEKALKYMENDRTKNDKRDIRLKIELNILYIQSKTRISHIFHIDPEKLNLPVNQLHTGSGRLSKFNMLVYASDSDYHSDKDNGWFLSGDGGPEFLSIVNKKLTHSFRIPSNDWIFEFAPRFDLGKSFVVEIPQGQEILDKAWKYIEQADESFRNWNTKAVYVNCRECGSLLDEELKNKIGSKSFSYKERWGRAYKRFKGMSFSDIASIDLHIEDLKKRYPEEEVKILKPDAEHLIIQTKALVNFAQELLSEMNN